MYRMHILLAGILLNGCGGTEPSSPTNPQTKAAAPSESSTPTSTPTPAAPENPIEPFVGSWRPSKDLCGDMSEYGLDISAGRLSYYEYSGQIETVRQNSDGSISVSIVASIEDEEGGSSTEEIQAQFSLSADGQSLTEVNQWNDTGKYMRCP